MFDLNARKRGVLPERNTPEFLTLVALAVGLGIGIVARLLRRRASHG